MSIEFAGAFNHPGSIFSIANFDFDRDDASINKWVVGFLRFSQNPNTVLAALIEGQPRFWVGPIEIETDRLVRVGGPGLEFDEDPDTWEVRISRIAETLTDTRQLPPLIVTAQGHGDDFRKYKLIVADGAHRLGAVCKLQKRKIWALVAFPSEHIKQQFYLDYQANDQMTMQSPYVGNRAETYDDVREQQPHWHTEHAAVAKFMQRHKGKTVLDAPVGTGRFLNLYQHLGCNVVGLDLSADMLSIAGAKAKASGLSNIKLIKASATDHLSESIDVSLCVRFINLIPAEIAERVVANFGKTTRDEMIIHLTSIDYAEVPVDQHATVDADTALRYQRQRESMSFAPHKLTDFERWASDAGFVIAESIECQEKHGYSRTHVHRLVRR